MKKELILVAYKETKSMSVSLASNPLFQEKIRSFLRLSFLKQKYILKMTDAEGMGLYAQAFTHSSVSPHNYEWLEILGDATLNKCVVWYINNRFPQLHNAEGVKVIARLKIKLVSKNNFSEIAEQFGFLPFIQINEENMKQKLNLRSVLEDVLEAFFGATEMLIDRHFGPGSGYGICYELLRHIMDRHPISLQYEDLYDPITRLKETFDIFRSSSLWGQVRYDNIKDGPFQYVTVFQFDPMTGRKVALGHASAPTLDEAKQKAATVAIEKLASHGFRRPVPEYYTRLGSMMV